MKQIRAHHLTLETVLDFTNFYRDHFLFPYQHLAIKKMMQAIHWSLKFALQNIQEFCLIWAESLPDIQVVMHWNSLQLPIYVIISFDNTKLPSYTLPPTQHHKWSTDLSNLPLRIFRNFVWSELNHFLTSKKSCTETPYGRQFTLSIHLITLNGKLSAQLPTTLCIQFLDRENNDKKDIAVEKTDLFYLWGCAEILPY